jgi:tight adherence protein B
MSPILYVLIFLAILLAVEGLRSAVEDRRRQNRVGSRRRLRELASTLGTPEAEAEGEDSLLRREGFSLVDRIAAVLPGRRELELRLYRADMTMGAGRFLTVSTSLALIGFIAGNILFPGTLQGLLFAGLGALPWVQAGRRGKKRARRFEAQFPDALDLLIRALRAGHSLSSGLQMVGEELPDPVGTEFGHLADEVQLGQPLKTALANLAHRVESEDLPFFVTAIAIQQETGSNLAEVLDNLSTVIRERFKVYGKVRALTAMGRASANLLAGWPLIMVGALYMVNEDYVAPLWETDEGHIMVLVSAIMVLFGYVVCRKMATIRV